MYVLGLNSVFHESAACLLQDGRIVAACEEERFNRVKHAKKPLAHNPHLLPYQAMDACLAEAEIDIRQVDYIGYSSCPAARRAYDAKFSGAASNEFVENIERVPDVLRVLGYTGDFAWVDHHLAHAASAFYASPFNEAAVLAVDGIGDDKTTATYHGEGASLELVKAFAPPHSIGFLWELVSMFIGFDIYDATKIMGLAAYGDPSRYATQFRQLMSIRPDGDFCVNDHFTQFGMLDYETPTGYFGGLEQLFSIRRRLQGEPLLAEHKDIAAGLQEATDEVLLHIARRLHEQTGARNLCVAGGVALNCVSNQRVFEQGPFRQLYVQPAAHDAGAAIGAAMHIWHGLMRNARDPGMQHAYLGPEFDGNEIEAALQRRGLCYQRCENIEGETAKILAEGEIVGWFQGRMEVGPRALGNRSLLADPRHPGMRDILNHKVKHREYFRPFAPSVLAEEAHHWFQIAKDTPASDFMLMAYSVPENLQRQIPAVLHTDGSCRIQTVQRATNPRYHRLISEFQKLTGVPIVLNTSFNDSEPIVCSPDDAIDTFLKTRIDYLAIGDFLVAKRENQQHQPELQIAELNWERLCPDLGQRLNGAIKGKRLCRLGDIVVLTDRADCTDYNQVLPLYAEQQFFIDQLPHQKVSGARALEIGVGSGVLSIAIAKAGAKHVVGLDINPGALELAEFNLRLNDCGDNVELRMGDDAVYSPVREERFDFIFSNPPFMPMPANSQWRRHSDAGLLGLDLVEKILTGLDDHLTPGGVAQLVVVCLGSTTTPAPLCEMASQLLAGRTNLLVNPAPLRYSRWLSFLAGQGVLTEEQSRQLARTALDNGCTHTLLAMLHYQRSGNHGVSVAQSPVRYDNWDRELTAVEP